MTNELGTTGGVMIRNILFAVRLLKKKKKTDAMYVVFKKSRDGVYDLYEDGQLYLNRKL